MRFHEITIKNDAGDIVAKASAEIETESATLALEGVFFLESVAALKSFLGDIKDLHVDRWILQLDKLEVMSQRGLRVLAKFVRWIRQRGGEVEISGIQPAVRAQLKAMPLLTFLKSRVKL